MTKNTLPNRLAGQSHYTFGQQLQMVTLYRWKSYSVLHGLDCGNHLTRILDPPIPSLFLYPFGCNLFPLYWKNKNHQRRFPHFCKANSTNPSPLLPLRSVTQLLSKASSVFLCSAFPSLLLTKVFAPALIPLHHYHFLPSYRSMTYAGRCSFVCSRVGQNPSLTLQQHPSPCLPLH